jgi:leucyl/phenylalanyl-tRNA--protein transferase
MLIHKKIKIHKLHSRLWFPDPYDAPGDFPLAYGGNLLPDRLILAYKSGIFPWYSKGQPILWWSPDPRFVLFLENLHIPSSLRRKLNKNFFDLRCDNSFSQVIVNCAKSIRNIDHFHRFDSDQNDIDFEESTWITKYMIDAYIKLHNLGYAHSIEAYLQGELVGGLYGVAIGKVFFGESMFYTYPDASKYAFVKFAQKLAQHGFNIIDCQVYTDNLARFGAQNISRIDYLSILKEKINCENPIQDWKNLF